MKGNLCFLLLLIAFTDMNAQQRGDPKLTEIWSPVPKVITPGKSVTNDPSSDAIILFREKKDTINWVGKKSNRFNWKADDNSITVVPFAEDAEYSAEEKQKNTVQGLQTKQSFGDCQLHIEWRTPAEVKGDGQSRGNSGVLFMGRYELQILDSYNNPTYSNGQAGSVYKQYMPMVNVCRPPGEWQTYDVIFTAPQFYPDSMLKSPARMTVFQNGVLIQNNVELWGSMQFIGVSEYEMHAAKEPLLLQDHRNPTSFRNIWIREL
ncbi:MAG: DUF1080 domain-containing protein [Bacteroidota bacterium]